MHYPGAVLDPDTGELISDAEVAEIAFTAFASTEHPVTARLIVRRVRDQAKLEELFPVWRYHPFFTNSTEPTVDADLTHRRHAIIETVFADLIDGPLAHMPSGRFGANSAWALCAAIAHNLLRAAGTLSRRTAARRGPRRDPAPPDRQRPRPTGPTATPTRAAPARALALGPTWLAIWHGVFDHAHGPPSHRLTPRSTRRAGTTGDPKWKSWADQQPTPAQTSTPAAPINQPFKPGQSTDRGLASIRGVTRV